PFALPGLPPTPEEIARFVSDRAPGAYETLIDRLLASPRYGERWGRHWLDVVRFGESQGFERDKPREHAWRYRDYVIAAVGQTFLGLTVNCARCHNHKFDPVPQRDYYRVKAALEGVRPGDRSV